MNSEHLDVGQQTLAERIESDFDCVRPRFGDLHEAVIVSIAEDEAIVHLPEAKRDGIVSANDLNALEDSYFESLDAGSHVPARVLRGITRHGQVVVSIRQGLRYYDWLQAEELLQSGETVEAEVPAANRGGFERVV